MWWRTSARIAFGSSPPSGTRKSQHAAFPKRQHSLHMTIEVDALTKVFEGGRRRHRTRVEAVRDISLSVAAGERIAYIGPNGAGKSTSIKMLTGILHPTSGSASVLGMTPWRQR